MSELRQYKLAYYGDDFSGSTDALDFLSRAGYPTVLFMEPPDKTLLSRFPDIVAFGVAGMTRTMAPEPMQETLRAAFLKISEHKPECVHYKVCSTFNSSPEIGNIGKAIETGADVFSTASVPLLVGNPVLGRFSTCGKLYATMGTDIDAVIYRIDRHPTMSRHPITPAKDWDIRDHLARQTHQKIALFDILELEKPIESGLAKLKQILNRRPGIVLFDILEETQFLKIGTLIESMRDPEQTLFTVGSSGVEAALCAHWQSTSKPEASNKPLHQPNTGPLLVASGRCSGDQQIETAISAGFREIAQDVGLMLDLSAEYIEKVSGEASYILGKGESVILHTNNRSSDDRLSPTDQSTSMMDAPAAVFSTAMGKIVLNILNTGTVRRVCFADGETSSHAAQALCITALELAYPFEPGAPVCRAHSSLDSANGIEVNFKGNQVGAADYFIRLLKASTQ